MKHLLSSLALAAVILTGALHAAPPLINYQGRIVVGSKNFEGTGQFKFALVDGGVNQNTPATATALVGVIGSPVFFISVLNGGSGYVTAPAVTITDTTGTGATAVATLTNGVVTGIQVTNGGSGYSFQPTVTIAPPPPNIITTTFWSNDQSSVGGSEPGNAVSLPVVKGLYSVLLGDNSLGAAMRTIGAPDLAHPDIRLRVWFDDGVNGSQLLTPDQRLAPAAYLAEGSVTASTIAGGALNVSHFPGSRSPGQVLGYNGTDIVWTDAGGGDFSLNGTNAFYNGGNVGIGTDTPQARLDVWSGASPAPPGGAGGAQPDILANINLSGSQPILQWSADVSFPISTRSWKAQIGETQGLEFWMRRQIHSAFPPTDTGWQSKVTFTNEGHIHYTGQLGKLDTAEQFVAIVRSADLYFGYSTRRGTPGRALVDDRDSNNPTGPRILALNYASDWDETHIGGAVTQVKTLRITGGADLAEPFQMKEEELEKGSVVVIDEEHPGRLKRSTVAYDTRVAGIISGANGVSPGIALHQEGVIEGGQNVALSGRVYVQADATGAPIKPGDLLTTSDTPGHAMKVTDHTKSQGAILGKAMSSLDEGTGYILVLVTLQ
jgi:hypothetical protein